MWEDFLNIGTADYNEHSPKTTAETVYLMLTTPFKSGDNANERPEKAVMPKETPMETS